MRVLTCGEGGGDGAAPHGVLGSLQAHGVLCGLRKPLQADPRVLGIHNQLLYMGPRRRQTPRATDEKSDGEPKEQVRREGKPQTTAALGAWPRSAASVLRPLD